MGKSGWTPWNRNPPRSTLNSPLGKTLLSVRSRSKSLPPESEEWELWGVAVPRGGEVNLSAGTSLPLSADSGNRSGN